MPGQWLAAEALARGPDLAAARMPKITLKLVGLSAVTMKLVRAHPHDLRAGVATVPTVGGYADHAQSTAAEFAAPLRTHADPAA